MVLALSFSMGLPSVFMQGAAWARMLVSFSKEAPLTESLAMTFDGLHPCGLCKAVEREETSKKKQNLLHDAVKIVLAMPEGGLPLVLPRPVKVLRWETVSVTTGGIGREPPPPPPKIG